MHRCCTRRARGTVRHNAEAPILYNTLTICTGAVYARRAQGPVRQNAEAPILYKTLSICTGAVQGGHGAQ
jgi:hypothetical protein